MHSSSLRPSAPHRRAVLFGLLATTSTYLLQPRTSALAESISKVQKTPSEWRSCLSPAAYSVLREEGTERSFSSELNWEHRRGLFRCAGCAQPLFSSNAKFDSGTGWPSFFQPLSDGVELRKQTRTERMLLKTEVHCKRCDGHIGHVFPDGPKPTGLRYCMNGVAMTFEPAP